jgi:hypothetical protein
MKPARWNPQKSEELKEHRGVSFEELLEGRFIEIRRNPGRPDQDLLLIEYQGYVWVVPFVETEEEIFLKTLYRSRKYTKIYRRKMNEEDASDQRREGH